MSDSGPMKPIRVLHVIGSLGLGGAQVYLKSLVENMDSSRVETWVYPLRPGPRDIAIQGTVIEVNYRNYDPRKFFTILRLCRKHRIDILHAHLHKPIVACLLATFFCKARVVVHEHGPVLHDGFQYSLYRWLLRGLCRCAALVVANSKTTAHCLKTKSHVSASQIKVLYNAIDFKPFEKGLSREVVRETLGISPETIVVGFVGRLDSIKGADLLVEVATLLGKEDLRYLVLIAGEGVLRGKMELSAKKFNIAHRIKFLGFQDNVAEVMRAVDVGIVPSRQESFGLVALEFMKSGVAVVCSGVDGLGELVRHEETGLITSENTPVAIVRAVGRVVGDESLRDRMVKQALEFVETFSVTEHVQALYEVYREVLCVGRSGVEKIARNSDQSINEDSTL